MKVGDYSSSGRTYTRVINTGSNKTSCPTFSFYFMLIPLVMSLVLLAFVTYKTPSWVAHLDTVKQDVDSGISSLYRNVEVSTQNLGDDHFRIEFPIGTMKATRNVEYCQWKETRHVKKQKIDDKTLEHTTFSYHKTWRRHRISSMRFDAAVAHHNPDYNPFPTTTLTARALLGQTLNVDGKSLPVSASEALFLTAGHFDNMRAQSSAWNSGFQSMDTRYIYHYHEQSTAGSILKGVAQFLVDGVIGTGIRGTCEPGDIRISYTISYATSPVSAIVNGDHIEFALPGDASVDNILDSEYGSLMDLLWYSRAASASLGFFVAFLFLQHRKSIQKGKTKKE